MVSLFCIVLYIFFSFFPLPTKKMKNCGSKVNELSKNGWSQSIMHYNNGGGGGGGGMNQGCKECCSIPSFESTI